MSFLKIQQLSKTFGERKVVNHLSFSLEKGKILAILGESGSGKTTLLQLIAALQEPDEGILLLDNEVITPPSQKLMAGHSSIKLVRQNNGNAGLFPNMTIRENIAYELRFYEEKYRENRVDKLLKISGLTKISRHLPRQVSGGEQQRTGIVKALALQPKLLLLDEPFSHLDGRNKQKMKSEILDIIQEDHEKTACIFVSHDVTDVYALADFLAIMQNGKFVQMGKPEEVYEKPRNQYVAEMTGNANILSVQEFNSLLKIPLILDKGTVMIRPEKIIIAQDFDFQARVLKVQMMGSFYEIQCQVFQIKLKFYSLQKIDLNTIVSLQIVDYHVFK